MENLPELWQAPETNIELAPTPSPDLLDMPAPNPAERIDSPELPVVEMSGEQWNAVVDYVVKGPRTAALALERKLNLTPQMAQAAFEELQAQGIVSKYDIPTPSKGAVRGDAYDQTRFGGFMVLVNPDGSSKAPKGLPEKPGKGLVDKHNKAQAERRHVNAEARTRYLGGGVLRRTAGYADLNGHRAASIGDTLSGHKRAVKKAEAAKIDLQYAEIFGDEPPSWMPKNTPRWERTTLLNITQPGQAVEQAPTPPEAELPYSRSLTPGEKEVDEEIKQMRRDGMEDGEIKKTLLKKYRAETASDGGNDEKAKRVSMAFMEEQPFIEDQSVHIQTKKPTAEAKPQTPETPAEPGTQPEPKAKAEQPRKAEAKPQPALNPLRWGIEYVAGFTRRDERTDAAGKKVSQNKVPFPKMSQESFLGACERYGLTPEVGLRTYKELVSLGLISDKGVVHTDRITGALETPQSRNSKATGESTRETAAPAPVAESLPESPSAKTGEQTQQLETNEQPKQVSDAVHWGVEYLSVLMKQTKDSLANFEDPSKLTMVSLDKFVVASNKAGMDTFTAIRTFQALEKQGIIGGGGVVDQQKVATALEAYRRGPTQ
ncbi:MAG TPA: hypothetical protein VG992_01965 [Candidatus Saccharimonadales bacterium]|nr:hypothetical protein [Candidatus Saccharimonadales bacterium]